MYESTTMDTTTTIYCLNDDCLLHVLKMLNLKDRISVERVCRRWHTLCQMLWRQQHVLRVSGRGRYFYYQDLSFLHCEQIQYLQPALIRCGNYLKTVKLTKIPNTVVLKFIGKYCPNIEHLSLKSITTSCTAITFLAKCKNLRTLQMCGCDGLTDDSLKPLLLANHNIEHLELVCCGSGITGSFLHHLSASIQHIFVCNLGLKSDLIIKNFKHFDNLLNLNLTYINENSLENCVLKSIVDRAPHLQELSLTCCSFLMDSYHYLSALNNLISLDLNDNQLLDDNSLKCILSGCFKLESLNISLCVRITNESVQCLTNLQHLKKLNISEVHSMNDETLGTLSNIKTLVELNCSGCDLITDAGVNAILHLCDNLIHLNLSLCKLITDSAINEAVRVMENRYHPQSNVRLTLDVAGTGVTRDSVTGSFTKLLKIKI